MGSETRERPSWTNYLLSLAFVASQRSHDKQTQHGCVITDPDHRVLGIGYNGLPRGFDDVRMSKEGYTDRPAKYPFMNHSERNAIANCTHRPENGIAYITGQCCNQCAQELWQNGVKNFVMALRAGSADMNAMDKTVWDVFVREAKDNGGIIEYVKPDVAFAIDYLQYVKGTT